MKINVKSKNQENGITAGVIYTDSAKKESKKKRWYMNPWLIAIGSGIIIFLITNNMSAQNIFNVSSKNQNGGITAGQVIIGTPDRKFTEEAKNQLLPHISKDIPLQVTAVYGDQEAFQYATQILDFLQKEGYSVDDQVHQGGFSIPMKGINLMDMDGGGIEIVVGAA